MPIASMTGFAREAGLTGPVSWAWELKSVNGRTLEARVRVPPGFDAVGEEARRSVASAFARGQMQLNLSVSRRAGPPQIRVNRAALEALLAAVGGLDVPAGVRPASLDGLLAVRGVVDIDDDGGDPKLDEALAGDLAGAVGRLVESLRQARLAEGAALAGAIGRQLDAIEVHVEAAESCPARQPDAIRAKLAAQVAALTEGGPGLDPMRLHAEAALLATRSDIREELDRLKAHAEAARALLSAGGALGRRLDFLAQEFGREANTLCSKAGDVALSRIGLDLKAVVEQFREQVQNVE